VRTANHTGNTIDSLNPYTNINKKTLTPLVRKSLNSETVEIVGWECKQVHGGAGTGTEIHRISGQARENDKDERWSLILKILKPPVESTDVSTWNYYKREADAYQSGLLADLPGGLCAPHCYGVQNHQDGVSWIWLEDVRDDIGPRWPIEHYGLVARQLGRFNGKYIGENSPDWPWLSVNWIRGWVERSAPFVEPLRKSLDHPLVKRWLPKEQSEKFFRQWEEREHLLTVLDRLPQTLCHLDAFRRNMFARRVNSEEYQTVLIDWAFVGRGPIGSELIPLIRGTTSFFEVDVSDFKRLEDLAFKGYMDGLRDAGWRGDPWQARLGYLASNIRYKFGTIRFIMNLIADEAMHKRAQQTYGCPVEELLDRWGSYREVYSSLDDEAIQLMNNTGISSSR
jgi:hypothetical protein